MLNDAMELVKEFMSQAHQPVAEQPISLIKERVLLRASWMHDEIEEFIAAEDVYEQTDAMLDLIYYTLGTLVELGVKPDELFLMLHENNMKKVEHLVVDANGKVQKPEGWKHPDEEIHRIIDSYKK